MKNLFVLCGPPATGKGYFSELMEELLLENGFKKEEIDLIPVGEILRKEKENGNDLVDKVVIDDETDFSCNVVMEIFKRNLNPKTKITMLDGIPRTVMQFKKFKEITKEYNAYVIFLNGGENVLMKKMLKRAKEQNRDDDNIANFKKRMAVYRKYTLPAILEMQKVYKKNFIEVSTDTDMTKERVAEVLKKVTFSK